MAESGPRVFIVDDRKENLKVMGDVFDAAGARVTTNQSSLAALDQILKLKDDDAAFDLVVIDIHMPEMDGKMLAQKLREGGYEKAIVAFTAHPTAADRRKGKELGIDHFMSKATLKVDLVRAILGQYC